MGLKKVVLSVKGDNVRLTNARDLRSVLEREEDAELAAFLCLKEPAKAIRDEAIRVDGYEYNGIVNPRIQFLTVQQLLGGKREIKTPTKVGTKISTGQMSFRHQ
jgi:hypothetical protein